MVTTVIDTCLNTALLLGRGLPLIWDLSQEVTGAHPGGFLHSLYFSMATDVIMTIISIPQTYYSTFVIEEKHGFNKQTQRLFWTDMAKSAVLRLALMHPITNGLVHFVVTKFGESFPNYLFMGGAGMVIAFTYVYPSLIQPLFNKFTELPEGELKDGIARLAGDIRFPLAKVYEVDGSKRSGHSNAYFFGFFNNKRIVLYDTLIKQLETREVLAVLSHEFGHWFHNHTIFMLSIGMGQIFSMCHLLKMCLFDVRILKEFGFGFHNTMLDSKRMNPVLGFQLMSMIFMTPVLEVLKVIMNAISRKFEFQADRFAADRMQLGTELRTALVKISKENKGNADPDWLYAMCNYSHPPMVERLAAIDDFLKKSE